MEPKLNILMIAMYLDYRIHGGLSRHAYELCKALKKLGCNVSVASMESNSIEIDDRIQVPSFPPITFLDFLSFNMNLMRRTRSHEIDVIHSQADRGFIFALTKRRPLVVTAHTSMKIGLRAVPANRHHPSPYLRVLTEKCTFMKADKVIVVSKSVGKSIQNDYGVKEEKITWIPNAVDVHKFNPNIDMRRIREKYCVKGPLLVCVTRLEIGRFVEKLIPMMKNVTKEIPSAKLIVVGDGPLKGSLQRLRDRHGLNESVILVGAKGDDELPYFYAAADLCVLPMVFPPAEKECTVLEALASGRPLVYVNRTRETDGDAPVSEHTPIATYNDRDFASSIIHLCQNEKKKKRIRVDWKKGRH